MNNGQVLITPWGKDKWKAATSISFNMENKCETVTTKLNIKWANANLNTVNISLVNTDYHLLLT